jgi:hypothetical protein
MEYVADITQQRLKEVVCYDPDTGLWEWLVTLSSRAVAGSPCGVPKGNRYGRIRIDGHLYQSHRLAWLYMTGAWPSECIDHINGNRADCRWVNLRESDHSENKLNVPVRRDNTSGVKGVCSSNEKYWAAEIKFKGLRIRRQFKSFADAVAFRKSRERLLHGEFAYRAGLAN